MKNEIGLAAISIILWLYFIASQICMIYFWHEWCQDHGFLNSLIIGPIVSEIKGLLFPFFIQSMDGYGKDDVIKALLELKPNSREQKLVDQRSYLIGLLVYRFMMTEHAVAAVSGYNRNTVNHNKRLPVQFMNDKSYMQNVYVYAQMFPFDFSGIETSKTKRLKRIELDVDEKFYNKLKAIGSILGHDDIRTTIKFFLEKSLKLWEE